MTIILSSKHKHASTSNNNSLETNRNYKTDKHTSSNETLLHGINRRVKMTKDRIREFANKNQYNSHNLNTEKRNWRGGNLRELCNTNRRSNIYITPVPAGERRQWKPESLKKLPNFGETKPNRLKSLTKYQPR